MASVLVTPRSVTRNGHPSLDKLAAHGHAVVLGPPGRQPSEDELIAELADCHGYIAGVEPVTARVIASAPGLRAISRNGTGVNNIDLAAARAAGIAVLAAQGANARGVAELTLAFLLALARGIPYTDACLKSEKWERVNGVELEGRTLGLVGCGRIGRLVTKMALGCDMRVVAYDPYPDLSFQPGAGFHYTELEEILTQADFLSLHCPPLPGGKPLLDAVAISRLKPGAFVIDTARFDLIDPAAMIAALENGRVRGLALDVFDTEPPTDYTLVRHPRVIATPHIGGFTTESIDRAMHGAVDNLIKALA